MRVSEPSTEEWDRLAREAPGATFFHRPAWTLSHERAYPNASNRTRLYSFEDGTAVLLPLVQRRKSGARLLYSSPDGIYGGFLWNRRPSPDQLRRVVRGLVRTRPSRIRLYPPAAQVHGRDVLTELGFEATPQYSHVLDLDGGFDRVWEKRLNAKTRNQVRKAEKSGVEVREGTTPADLESYYAIYLASTKRWNLPAERVRPLAFYQSVVELGGEDVRLRLASKDGVDIAGSVTLLDERCAYYWCGAMLFEYGKVCPNNLVQAETLRHLSELGIPRYDMLGSGGLKGVIKFKEGFGALREENESYQREGLLMRLYRKLRRR